MHRHPSPSLAAALLILAAVLPGVALLACATIAQAQPAPQLLWSFRGNGSLQAIAATPDIDGDGGPDIAFEGYENGPTGVNHVFAIRGASAGTGEVLWAVRPVGGVSSGGGYGDNCLRLGPDLNGDGLPELLLGTAWGGRTAFALNGLSGATVWGYDTYAHYGDSQSGWIYAMDSLGSDLTNDGVPEVVFASGSFNDRVHCVNGANGAQVWVYYGGDAFFDVRSCQDINGDGVRDVVAALGDNDVSPRVVALSGSNGSVLWQRPVAGNLWNLTFISDIDSDGIREIVPSEWGSTLYCISGRTGAVLWNVAAGYQQRVATLDDVNGDGIQDVAVGFNTASQCRVVSGANGATLWTTPASDWTWAVDRVADCTGDGINDVAVGDFNGRVYVINGATGAVFWSWLNPTGDKIMTIRGVPDLNGNGVADVVAGTQLLYGGTGGWVYALEGNSNPTSTPPVVPALAGIEIGPASPNPSSGTVRWLMTVQRAVSVRLIIFSADGRRVRDLGERSVGSGGGLALRWDGRDESGRAVSAGVYRARLYAGSRPVADRGITIVR